MDIDLLSAYLPLDRRHALASGHPLPDQAEGAVLLTDLAGFTPLADALATTLGPQRGAEELTHLLNAVYDALIAQVHRYGGSVVSFSGDGLVCWFDGDLGLRAVACGLAMQQAIPSLAAAHTLDEGAVSLSIKGGVAAGPARRFLVGDPQIDLLAGATLDQMAQVEQVAGRGEVVVGPVATQRLGDRLRMAEWREGFGVLEGLAVDVPPGPWPALDSESLTAEQVRPYLLPPIYERLAAGQGEFLAELRPAVALFLRFEGLDYDRDDAGPQLDAYVRWVQGVLGRFGGTLLQLTAGDKGSFFYAAFGALAAHEDDAERALAAALELQHPPSDLGFITAVQIGLSRGRVRAGAYGSRTRRTYGAIGAEAIVACRLMEVAPPGEVWCSPAICQAVGQRWAFEPLPPLEVKGKAEPLPVYQPLHYVKGRAVRVAGALVGRQAEMETLIRLLDEAGAGQRRVLLLEGEAGIGKSRLVGELARMARERGVAWLEGAGQSIEQETPYRAWRDVLAAHFDLSEGMDRAERGRQVAERVTEVNPAFAERAPLLNDVLRLDLPETDLTRGFDPKLRHESLTALVVDLLRAATADGPLVLTLEDAHWLDSLSWELALAVARAQPSSPVGGGLRGGLLLVLALRPLPVGEPLRAEYTALAGLEGAETLRLEALPPEETVALAAARLGVELNVLPGEVAELVQERAGGNPFFAEELTHVLRDSGAVTVEEGACTLTGDLDTLRESVPDTVEGVVLARIDRLPAEQQLTLKVAAVIGRSFLYRTLHDVHPRQVVEDPLRTHLDDLAWRGLTPLESLEPELSYRFKHVITKQVAYDTLLFAQRRELHRAVAGWYERVYAGDLDPYYPLLAHHWQRAEDVNQERRYARLAGEQAAAQYANAEAVTYLSRALELTPEGYLEERCTLLLAREKVYDLQGTREAQSQDLETLRKLADALHDDGQQVARRRGEIALRQANHAEAIGEYPAAITAAQETIRLAQTARDARLEAAGHQQWGRVLWQQGDIETAQSQLEVALALARRASLHTVEAESLRSLGVIPEEQGDYARAREYFEQSLRIFREISHRQGEAKALNNLGIVSRLQGDYARARGYLEQALRIYREIGGRQGEAKALNNLGLVLGDQSNYAGSRAYYEQALRIHREIGNRQGEGIVLANLGVDSGRQGDLTKAGAYFEQALRIHRELGGRLDEGKTLGDLGLVSRLLGDYARARTYYEQSLHINREVGDRQGESVTLNNLGVVCRLLGDYVGAKTYQEQALRIGRQIGDRQGESASLNDLSFTLHHLGDDQTAQEYGQRALVIAQDLGARSKQGYILTNLGHARVGLGHLDEAATAYQQALDLRRELGQHHLAMESLAGLARVSLAQGDPSQAQNHVDEILEHLETATLDGTDEPFRVYLTCYQVLRANKDLRAQEVLTTAYALLQEWAAKIGDEALRHSFLENVAANREIVAACRAMEAGGENGQTRATPA
jgi:predicted ATPase/class 3 adenylate cyclase